MINSLEILLSANFLLLALASSAIVYFISIIVDYIFMRFRKVAKENKTWKELVLPILPLITGVVLGYMSDTIVLGLVAGLLSGLIYRVIKAKIKSFTPELD